MKHTLLPVFLVLLTLLAGCGKGDVSTSQKGPWELKTWGYG